MSPINSIGPKNVTKITTVKDRFFMGLILE